MRNDRGEWCLAALEGPDLWRVEGQEGMHGLRWLHYRLSPVLGVRAIAKDNDAAARTRQKHGPFMLPIAEAVGVFERCGASALLVPENRA